VRFLVAPAALAALTLANACLLTPIDSSRATSLSIACASAEDCPEAWRCELVHLADDDCGLEPCPPVGRCAPPEFVTVTPEAVVASTAEDTPVTLALLVDDDVGQIVVREPPRHGALTLDAARGTARYEPAVDFAGVDTVGYVVVDGAVASPLRIATITVVPQNDPPRAPEAPATLLLDEDGAAAAATVVVDVDGDPLRWTLVADGLHGRCALTPETGLLVYQPRPDVHGDDRCALRVDDGQGGTLLLEQPVRILPIDDPPRLAMPPRLTTPEDQPLTVALGGADGCAAPDVATAVICDVDTPYTELAISVTELATDGVSPTATPSESRGLTAWTWAPPTDFAGARRFSLRVADAHGDASALFDVDVIAVADPAVGVDDVVDLREDGDVAFVLRAVAVDAVRFEVVAPPAHGTLASFDPVTGAVRYVPARDFAGDDALRFVVLNDEGVASAPATITLHVEADNDAPTVLLPAELVIDEDAPLELDIAAVVLDVDGDVPVITARATPGSVTVEAGRLRFVPPPDFVGAAVLTVVATDAVLTAEASRPVTVRPVADAPMLAPAVLLVDEDGVGAVDLVAASPDGAPVFVLVQDALHGQATVDPGVFTASAIEICARGDFSVDSDLGVITLPGDAKALQR
jgi:hypothetical protein